MSATRRGALGVALAAPLLARFTGTAAADAAPGGLGTISDGWVEVRWTPQAQAQLDRFEAVVEAAAPARLLTDSQGSGVWFPVRFGAGDPSPAEPAKAQGGGGLDGGVVVRTPTGTFRLTDLRSDLQGELASGKCAVNGIDVMHGSVFQCGLAEGVLTTDTVPPGEPMTIRLAEMPLRPTSGLLDMYAATFGAPAFTTDTVLGYVTAQGVYNPPKA